MDFPLVIFCTTSDENEAKLISETLVKEKLAACVNRIPGLQSIYFWNKQICDDQEWLLLIKSKKSRLDQIIFRIKAMHNAEVPEIIALPIMGGSEDYLEWLETNTQ
ncbi:divalent-cation tolerance protein CutA [bacterium]|nr:divalent-cation tolerance protein CutA [bacterium]